MENNFFDKEIYARMNQKNYSFLNVYNYFNISTFITNLKVNNRKSKIFIRNFFE